MHQRKGRPAATRRARSKNNQTSTTVRVVDNICEIDKNQLGVLHGEKFNYSIVSSIAVQWSHNHLTPWIMWSLWHGAVFVARCVNQINTGHHRPQPVDGWSAARDKAALSAHTGVNRHSAELAIHWPPEGAINPARRRLITADKHLTQNLRGNRWRSDGWLGVKLHWNIPGSSVVMEMFTGIIYIIENTRSANVVTDQRWL